MCETMAKQDFYLIFLTLSCADVRTAQLQMPLGQLVLHAVQHHLSKNSCYLILAFD